MSAYFFTTCVLLAMGGGYVYTRDRMHALERVTTISDAVCFVSALSASQTSTDDLLCSIRAECAETGLTAQTVARISQLHVLHGADNGIRGYSINVLWSGILSAIDSAAIILLLD